MLTSLHLAALVWVVAVYGTDRDYLFEVIMITVDWSALAVGAVLLGGSFRFDLA